MQWSVEKLTKALSARPISLVADISSIDGSAATLADSGTIAKAIVHPKEKIQIQRPSLRYDHVVHFRHQGMDFQSYKVRETFIATIPNCSILGERFVILTANCQPVLESIPTRKGRRDRAWATRNGQSIDRYLSYPSKRIEGPLAIITNGNWRNYWHWHIQCVSNIQLLREAGIYESVRLLAPPLNSWRSETLRLLNVDPAKLVSVANNAIFDVDRLYYPSYLNKTEQYFVNPRTVDTFSTIAQRVRETAASQNLPERIYVARLDTNRRRLANEQELAERLGELGFTTIVPGALSYKDQVKSFSQTRWIVGPHGAGLTNVLFTPNDCGLIELFPASRLSIEGAAFRVMAQMTGRPYYGYADFEERQLDGEWRIDVAAFLDFVSQAMAEHVPGSQAGMRHFKLMKTIDVSLILAEVEAKQEKFYADTSRQRLAEQRETMTIHLRSGIKPYPPGVEGRDFHESRRTKMYEHFPVVTRVLEKFAEELGGELSRATIVSLQPFGQVYRHYDRGEYYRSRDRYHLVLKSKLGSILTAGDERIQMKAGELWWFNNNMPHEAFNESDESRIHVIFDVLPRALIGKVKTIVPKVEDQD